MPSPRFSALLCPDFSADWVLLNHGYVITGSSNLSHSGLEGNLEFNVLLHEPEEHDWALHRFNELSGGVTGLVENGKKSLATEITRRRCWQGAMKVVM